VVCDSCRHRGGSFLIFSPDFPSYIYFAGFFHGFVWSYNVMSGHLECCVVLGLFVFSGEP